MVPPVVYCTGDLCDPISKIAAVNFHRRRNRNREQRRSEGQAARPLRIRVLQPRPFRERRTICVKIPTFWIKDD